MFHSFPAQRGRMAGPADRERPFMAADDGTIGPPPTRPDSVIGGEGGDIIGGEGGGEIEQE